MLPAPEPDPFPRRLHQRRISLQLSQEELAELVGIARTTIARMEAGRARPTLDLVRRIATALGTTVGDLIDAPREPARAEQPPAAITPGVLGPDGRPLRPGDAAYGRMEVAFRGVSGEVLKRLAQSPALMRELHWRDFEHLIAELFARDGFDVTLTPSSGDRGADLYVARRTGLGTLLYVVECKQRSRPIGPDLVRQLAWVVDRERATGGVLATTSRFTPGAVEESRTVRFRLSLKDYDDLRRWLLGAEVF